MVSGPGGSAMQPSHSHFAAAGGYSRHFAAAVATALAGVDPRRWIVFDAELRFRFVAPQLLESAADSLSGGPILESIFGADAGRIAGVMRGIVTSGRSQLGTAVRARKPEARWTVDAHPVMCAARTVGVLLQIDDRNDRARAEARR
jgi:hypothetical protein